MPSSQNRGRGVALKAMAADYVIDDDSQGEGIEEVSQTREAAKEGKDTASIEGKFTNYSWLVLALLCGMRFSCNLL